MDPEAIIREACNLFKIKEEVITDHWGETWMIPYRFATILAIRMRSSMSYPQIGRLLRRHHTTIMNACTRARTDVTMYHLAMRLIEVIDNA